MLSLPGADIFKCFTINADGLHLLVQIEHLRKEQLSNHL